MLNNLSMPRKTTQQTQVDANAILDQIERVVRWGDAFRLAFVKCNHSLQQEAMRHALLNRLSDKCVLEVFLEKPIISLLDELTTRWEAANPPDAVCVYGLERSITAQREASHVLGRLNHDRDLLRRAVPAALLIWLPDFALDSIARGAPDFWAWRSGVYEFATDTALWQMDSVAALAYDTPALFSLPLEDKQKEIARLEELLVTARTLPQRGKREQEIVGRLLGHLGLLYASLGNWDRAQVYFEEGLAVFQRLDDQRGVAWILHQLGTLHQEQGDLAKAARLYAQSLPIAQELGERSLIATTLHNLGSIQHRQGNLVEAARLYEQSLQIARELGEGSFIAITLSNLGSIQHRQGNLVEAARLYEQGLQITQESDDQSGIAHALLQLGRIQEEQGNLEEAGRFYEQSLRIAQEIGNKSRAAITLGQIGQLRQGQGRLHEALQNYARAWVLFRELQLPDAQRTTALIQEIREQVGDQQFQVWLREELGKQASQLVEALAKER